MAINKKKTDLINPIKIVGQGSCPNCRNEQMVLNIYQADHIFLNQDGLPIVSDSVCKKIIMCPKCGFSGKVGDEFIKLEDGSYKLVTEAEAIYEINRMKNLADNRRKEYVGLKNNNPFVEKENG